MQRDDCYPFVDGNVASSDSSLEGAMEWTDGARWILILSATGWLVLIGLAAII
jgi:hypothetical protein